MTNSSVRIDSATMVAEAAKQSLREAIFWGIAYNTNFWLCGHLQDILETMKATAKAAVPAASAEILCDDYLIETIRFGDDPDRQVTSLRHLQRVLLQHGCWFEDTCGEGIASFCWRCCGHKYQIIFR